RPPLCVQVRDHRKGRTQVDADSDFRHDEMPPRAVVPVNDEVHIVRRGTGRPVSRRKDRLGSAADVRWRKENEACGIFRGRRMSRFRTLMPPRRRAVSANSTPCRPLQVSSKKNSPCRFRRPLLDADVKPRTFGTIPTPNGDTTMRVMVIVKASKESEAGVLPGPELLAAMGKFNQEL